MSRKPSESPAVSKPGMFDKILGKAKINYREGLRLSFWEGKYPEAIPYFDKPIEIDPFTPICLARQGCMLPGDRQRHGSPSEF